MKLTEYTIKKVLTEILYRRNLCESTNEQNIINFFYNKLLLEKLLVGQPVTIPELRKLLYKKILNFEFIKLDGEVRPARGTTMMKYIPQSDHPKGIRPSSTRVATFFDMNKKAWRSVSMRSKEVVLKYAYGEKEKPVFIVRDKEKIEEPEITKAPEIKLSPEEKPKYGFHPKVDFKPKEKELEEPEAEIEDIHPVRMPEVKPIEKEPEPEAEIEDIHPVRMPEVKPIEKKPKYGFRPKIDFKAKEKELEKPEIKPIVRPSITSPDIFTPSQFDQETEIILPQQVEGPKPIVSETPPAKEPPLKIEPEDEELI